MFVWSKNGKKSPAPAGREVAVQKVDRIKEVRNLVMRPPVYGAGRRKPRGGSGGGAAGAPLAPPRVGGGGGVQGDDIDKKSSEYIMRVRRMWFHSHNIVGAVAPMSPPA